MKSKNSSGSALLSVLITILTVNTIVLSLVKSESHLLYTVSQQIQFSKLRLFQITIIEWIKIILFNDRNSKTPDSLHKVWAAPIQNLQIQDGILTAHIEDMNGRFNISNIFRNNKADPLELHKFIQFLEILQISLEDKENIIKWISKKSENLEAIIDIDQFHQIPGITQEILDKITPLIIALPERSKININTASAPVMAAILDIPLEKCISIVSMRKNQIINSEQLKTTFADLFPAERLEMITFRSEYFLLIAYTSIEEVHSHFSVLIHRPTLGLFPQVVWQKTEAI